MKQLLTEWKKFLVERPVNPSYYPPQFQAMIKELLSLAKHNWIFFDTETTGLPDREGNIPDYIQITQLAAIAYNTMNLESIPQPIDSGMFNVKIILLPETVVEKDRQQDLLDSDLYKGNPAYSIPGLLKMNQYAGGENVPRVNQEDAAIMFNKYIADQKQKSPSGKLVFWAHNSPFDAKMTNMLYKRGGITSPDIAVMDSIAIIDNYFKTVLRYIQKNPEHITGEEKNIIDAITLMSRKTKKRPSKPYLASKLGNVATAFKINPENWHEATADIGMTMEVLYKTLEYLRDPARGGRFNTEKLSVDPKYKYNRK
jgi:hypothetical protein